jgi:two-component system, sensor histidine kinase ChiS
MKRTVLLFCFLTLVAFVFSQPLQFRPEASLDLGKWNVSAKKKLVLDGTWEFYPTELLSPENFTPKNSPLLVKPSSWNGLKVDGKELGGKRRKGLWNLQDISA